MAVRVRSSDVAEAQRQAIATIPPESPWVVPQDGPQKKFAECGADIAVYGGAAGSGKTYALELEPCRNVQHTPGYSCVIFRRSMPSIRNPGSLWDQSYAIYQPHKGTPTEGPAEWEWPAGGKVKFAHLEYESTVFDWHAAQVTLICFDELTEFTEKQFFYMLSRNRSTCDVHPYMRATCNPDADSWVAKLIEWWIDQEETLPNGSPNPRYGFAIPERSGKCRFFVRVGNDLRWADHVDELTHELLGIPRFAPNGTEIPLRPLSFTFIAASIYDNQALLTADPDYLAKLLALPTVERERLLNGNWKIRPAPGLYFNRSWVEIVDRAPEDALIVKRGWDLAATEKNDSNDPDWTSSVKIGKDIVNKIYYVMDGSQLQGSPYQVDQHVKTKVAGEGGDGPLVEQWFPQDPGQAGKHQVRYLGNMLDGAPVRSTPERGDKVVRFSAFSATAQAGRVKVVRGPWNSNWFTALEAFPSKAHDDYVDATSRAFNSFLDGTSGLIEFYQIEAEKLRLSKLADKSKDMPTMATGAIKVKAPSESVNMLYDMKGRMLLIEPDGTFIVTPAHAEVLVGRSGFKYANGGPSQQA